MHKKELFTSTEKRSELHMQLFGMEVKVSAYTAHPERRISANASFMRVSVYFSNADTRSDRDTAYSDLLYNRHALSLPFQRKQWIAGFHHSTRQLPTG